MCSRRAVVIGVLNACVKAGRALGPYLLIELLVPGGSVLALLLWCYRMRRARIARALAAE